MAMKMGGTHDRTSTRGADDNTLTELALEHTTPDGKGLQELNILVFGADQTARKPLHAALAERGHPVVSTDDANAARELFDRHRSDIVFLCGLDGVAFEFSKYVRRVGGERTLIVGYSTDTDPSTARSAIEENLDETIIDRFDQDELHVKLALMELRAKRRIRWSTLETELRSSENRYRLLAEHATDMISRHTPDGTYTFASPASRRLLGYEPEELVGRSAYDFFHPEDKPMVRESHDGLLEMPDVATVEYRIRKKNGDYIRCETTSQTVRNEESGEVESIIAVSRRRREDPRAREVADRCRRELRDTQRLARIGSWYWDLETDQATLSDEVYQILGLDPKTFELNFDSFMERVHPQDQHMVRDRIQAARKGSDSLELYYRIVRPDGQIRTVCGRGELEQESSGRGRFVGTVQDFTELAAVEEALLEREAQHRAILETTVDGVITISETGIIETFNSAAERIFGYEASEMLGKNVSTLMPRQYAEEHDTYIRSYLETGHKRIIGIGREVIGRRKNGKTFPLELAVSEVELPGRRIFSGIIRDVSDRRQLEQQILNISEQERQRIGQDLHDGLGQMLTGIGLIMKNVSKRLGEKGLPEAEDVEEVTDLIREADEYARSLARGLIPVELDSGGLASAFQRLLLNAEKLFGLVCSFEQVGGELEIENTIATHLYRIAQESLSNAVRHGQASQVKVILATGEGQVRLRILDNGRGFPDQIDKNHPGMGIRIMRYRARIIGATLEVRSRPEGGTVIVCTLPRAAALQANV